MQLTRVSQFSAIELGEVFGADLNDVKTYIYDFNDSTGKQVLGDDSGNNSRNYSITPYLQNVLMDTTPVPYFPNTYHDSREINTLLGGDLPIVQFQKVRFHMSAGFTYPSHIHGLWFRVYVKINNVEVTLCSIIDEYFATRFKPNNREYVLENQVFTQHLDVDILDVNYLFSQRSEAFKNIIELFTNGEPVTYVSGLMVDFGFIENGAKLTFVKDGMSFDRISTFADFRSQMIQKSSEDDSLYTMITLRKDDIHYLEFKMAHTTLAIDAYFSQFNELGEDIDIYHQVTLLYYGTTNELISTQTIELSDFRNKFAPLTYIPNQYYGSDHILISLTSKAENSSSGQTWIRTSELVVLTSDIKPENEVFEFTSINVKNEITKIEQKIERSSDLPTVIEILKPIYSMIVNRELNEISLSPFDSAHTFEIDTSLVISKKLTLRIGERVYTESNRTTTSITFLIKALEYYRSETEWYIVDSHTQELYRGKIKRYGS